MHMPAMTGAELARRILALRPGMPILLCTGFSEQINAEKAKAIGIREFVMKPIIARELTGALRRMLD